MADFEEAPARAVRQVFGNDVMVSGCWIHCAQALVKRLRKIGLTDSYNSHQETQTIFRALMALPLLPMADIRPAFDDVKWAFTCSDRRTDRSVRLVCPTGRSDDRIV